MTELRKRGVGTAVICSGPFVKLGQTQSRVFGVPELPIIVIPHPLGGISLDGVRGRAEVAIAQLLELLGERIR